MAALIENYQAFCIQITVSFIKECLAKGDVTTPAQLFSKVWHRLKFDPDFMYAFNQIEYPLFRAYRLNLNEKLHLFAVMTIRGAGINYIPKIIFDRDESLDLELNSTNPTLFVSVHDGFAFATTILLRHYRKSVSIVTSDPDIGKTLGRTGLRPDHVELITNDFRSLGRLRTSMLNGVISANCVDFADDDKVFRFIKPTMFRFAIQQNFSMYFVKRQILDDGCVYIYRYKHNTTQDANADAQAFINFEKSEIYSPERTYTLKDK